MSDVREKPVVSRQKDSVHEGVHEKVEEGASRSRRWREANLERHRAYMREYMKRRRAKNG